MANPAPCAACLEVADAEFYVTNRLGVPWPFDQSTVALCVPCFINTGIQMGQALQAAIAEMGSFEHSHTWDDDGYCEECGEDSGPAQKPGALEQVEADEGKVKVAAASPKRSRKKNQAAPQPEPDAALPEESEAADDHG